MNRLVGKTVKELCINPARDVILFRCDDGDFYFVTEGDCCSESWIEHIDDLDHLIGKKIVRVEEVSIDTDFPGTRQDVDRVYLVRLTVEDTYNEFWSFEFRNSSNGYYGGSLSSTGEYGDPITQEQKDSVKPIAEKF
jgi:hypothetical protein